MGLVSDNFLSTMGIPLLRGRGFAATDTADGAKVVMISQITAERYFPGQDPVGKRIAFGNQPGWRTIVGVTGNLHNVGLDKEPETEIFGPLRQFDDFGPHSRIAVGMDIVGGARSGK